MSEIAIEEIFEVTYGTKLDMNKMSMSSSSSIAFVSRSSKNNGIVGYVDEIDGVSPLAPGLITVTLGGTYVLSSFLQDRPFYTAQNVAVLTLRNKLSKAQKLYYCMCISANRFRYSAFGREANRTLRAILVPSVDAIPSWVSEIDFNRFENANERKILKDINPPEIKDFARIDELFYVKNGIAATGLSEKEDRFTGGIMFVRPASTHLRTKRSFIEESQVDMSSIYPEGTLFVSTNGEGSHTYSYVSTERFVPNSDVSVLLPKVEMPLEVKMYYAKCITANRYLFSYGRKPKGDKLKKIIVPKVTESNFDEVSQFINSLKYSASAFT
jgi:hypothetical protein